MEFRHLYTFQAIVEEGSFLQAAERLQYAQSTITLHIQQLETELGVKLFLRQGRKLHLTTAGKALRDHADQLIGRAETLQQTMKDLVNGEAGHLRIGSIEPTASLRLSSLLIPFCHTYSKVKLTLEIGSTHSISQLVAAGELDLGICSPPPAHLGLSFEPLFIEPMVLVLPEEHSLAKQPQIQIGDLAQERLLLTGRGCAYREVIEKALLQHGTNPYSNIEIGSLQVLKEAVQGELGIAILPAIVASPPLPRTTIRELPELDLGLLVGFIRLDEDGPPGLLLNALMNALRALKCKLNHVLD